MNVRVAVVAAVRREESLVSPCCVCSDLSAECTLVLLQLFPDLIHEAATERKARVTRQRREPDPHKPALPLQQH